MSLRKLSATAVTAVLGSAWLIAGGGSAAAATASGPWAQTDYNAAASRANLGETTLTTSSLPRVRLLRKLTPKPLPPGGCGDPGFVAPVLADGRVFAVAADRLVSYDAATGRRLWQALPDPTLGNFFNSVAVAHGLVITDSVECGSASDPAGEVQAFRESNGVPAWTLANPYALPYEQVVVSGGSVLAVGASAGGGQVITVAHLSTGTVAWQRYPQGTPVFSPALITGGLVIQQEQSGLVAYRLSTGAKVWSRPGVWQPERGDLAATTAHHFFAVNPAGQVADLSPQTGRTQHILAQATSVLAVDNSRAYALCYPGFICGYRLRNGIVEWSQPDSSTLAAEAGGLLYLADGKVLDAASGAPQRQLFPGTAAWLVVGQGRIAASLGSKLDLFGLPGS